MKATSSTIPLRRLIALVGAGLLTLSACTSDPGPKRVAQDIIETEAMNNPKLDEKCLLDKLDTFKDKDLAAIAEGLTKTGSADENTAKDALAKFTAALETCN